MARIVLDNQQAKVVAGSTGTVEVCDENGNFLGFVTPGFSAAEVAEARRRAASKGPKFTTQQVIDHLRSLKPS